MKKLAIIRGFQKFSSVSYRQSNGLEFRISHVKKSKTLYNN